MTDPTSLPAPLESKRAADDFTAGVLLALAGFDENERLELKAGPPGATFPSPDPGATKLRKYWTRGEGAAKIRWGTDGDFNRCVTHLRKFVGERAKGLCQIYHRSALHGARPGQGHKSEQDSAPERKDLWVPDSGMPGGWRAHEPAWELKTKEVAVVDDRDDDTVMSDLDKFEKMQPSVEEAYELAIAEDIQWDLEAGGELVAEDAGDDVDTAGPSLFDEFEDES